MKRTKKVPALWRKVSSNTMYKIQDYRSNKSFLSESEWEVVKTKYNKRIERDYVKKMIGA